MDIHALVDNLRGLIAAVCLHLTKLGHLMGLDRLDVYPTLQMLTTELWQQAHT